MPTYETRGVVIPCSFGISERLEDRIGLDNLIFQGDLLFGGFRRRTNLCEIGDDLLCVFRLPSTRLSPAERYIMNCLFILPCPQSISFLLRDKDGLVLLCCKKEI